MQVGYWRDGVTLMRRSLALTGDSAFARVLLGDALYVQSRTEEALGEFEHAVRLSPDDPENYFRLGWVLQDLKRYDEAADQFRASLAVDEKISSTHNRLGWILWWQHQYPAAAREFDRAIELDDTNVGAYLNRAGLSRALGNFRRSIADCQRGLAASPRSTDCRRLIAFNLRDLGQLDEAVHQLQNVLTLDPEDSEARTELAHIQSMIAEPRSHGPSQLNPFSAFARTLSRPASSLLRPSVDAMSAPGLYTGIPRIPAVRHSWRRIARPDSRALSIRFRAVPRRKSSTTSDFPRVTEVLAAPNWPFA